MTILAIICIGKIIFQPYYNIQVKDENFETGMKDLVQFISEPEKAGRIIEFSIKLTTSSTDGPITELMLSLKARK